jgi:hypothetical protein
MGSTGAGICALRLAVEGRVPTGRVVRTRQGNRLLISYYQV